uniref:Regulator of G protein signaling 22 n=1 Tax=Amphiprion percula TaxID=161767 RepID=A0A3P8SDG8_AMPPE
MVYLFSLLFSRLAKILLQWDPNFCIHRRSSSSRTTLSAPQLRCSSEFNKENNDALKALRWSHSEKNISAKRGVCHFSICLSKSGHQTHCTNTDKPCECKVYQHSVDQDRERLEEKVGKVQHDARGSEWEEKTDWEKKNREVESRGAYQQNVLDICCHGTCCYGNRPGLDEFKEFLRGTPGEKILNLWTPIICNDLKNVKNLMYLVLMRSWYLLSSSQSCLNVGLLSRLGLTTSPCWTEEKLCSVQPCLTESLLNYWAPRFWTSHFVRADCNDSSHIGPWAERCHRPLSSIQPCDASLIWPLPCPDTYLHRLSHTVHKEVGALAKDTISCIKILRCKAKSCKFSSVYVFHQSFSRGHLLYNRRMEKMLQALYADSRAGLYFTHFCEQSGNQFWVNAMYFWTDLQHYHELFYQGGWIHTECRERRRSLLYSTYLFSSARRSLGVEEEIRREVYDGLRPAFEELFDGVEEYTLNILLEPWTLLANRDKESFQQVTTVQPLVDLLPFYWEDSPFSKGPHASDSWSSVSPNYQGYRLGSLFRHRHEIGHFMSFLQNQDASIHLTCWLDLEQYRRTPQKDKAIRQERSAHIAKKYLNRKYFFGSDSPATTQQQNDILRLAGGLERLKLDCLSNPVIVEIQDIVRNHIEKTWLPLFLSTAEFTERQRLKPKVEIQIPHFLYGLPAEYIVIGVLCHVSLQAEGLWMSSSKEILLFRRILLNPVTCQQFQHFVSLKGDFLENDVLFWLEVQRYKDLCHSHSDEATIQQKISTIISCFINSSMPPALQIDIPPEQAQHILDKRHELGPYIFREAQMSVFSELLKCWPEFQKLSSSIQKEQLLPLLQKKRAKYRARVRRQRRKEEEEEEEENERRRMQVRKQRLSWSYSKYMAGLKREEALLRRQSQLEASFSTVSGTQTHLPLSPRAQGNSHIQLTALCYQSD